MIEESVTISLWKFEELLKKSDKYDKLIQKLIETSELSWSKDRLCVGSAEVSYLLNYIEPVLYEARLHKLISDDKKRSEEDED